MDVAEFTLRLNAETAAATRQIQNDVNTAKAALRSLDSAVSVRRSNPLTSPPRLSDLQREKRAIGLEQYRKNTRIQAFRELGMGAEADKLAGIERPASTFELVGKGLRAAGIDLSYTKLIELGSIAAGVAVGVMAVKTAFDFVEFSIENVVSAGFKLGEMLVSATADALAFTQQSRMGFGMLLDSGELGAQVFDQVRKEAVQLGLEVDTAVDSFRKLLAAQFSVGQSNELLKVGADLQAIGTSATDVKHALLAITQIKMKGKLQAEELTRQLANAGVSSELVYLQLQRRMGIPLTAAGRDRVMKMQKAGQISADVAIPAIIDAIKAKVHESAAGQMAGARASATIPGMVRQSKGMLSNAFIDIAETIDQPVTAAVSTVFDSFRRFMDSPLMGELKQSISDTFISAANFVREYWPQIEPVIVGVGSRAVAFFRDAATYISNNGDEIAGKIGLIARVAWQLGSVMVTVTGWAIKLGDALLSIADFFDRNKALTNILIAGGGVALAPFTAGTSLLGAGAALDLFNSSPSLPYGPGEALNNLARPDTNAGVDDLLANIDKRKTGLNSGGFGQAQPAPSIGTLSITNHVQALDLSDPDVAASKLSDVITRGVHRVLEDSQ